MSSLCVSLHFFIASSIVSFSWYLYIHSLFSILRNIYLSCFFSLLSLPVALLSLSSLLHSFFSSLLY